MYVSDLMDKNDLMKIVKDNGFEIEVTGFVNKTRTLNDQALVERLKGLYPAIGCIHGPFRGLDFTSSDMSLVKRTLEAYEGYHKNSLALGCPKLVVHNSYSEIEAEFDLALERGIRFWREYLKAHRGVTYYVENINDGDYRFLKALHDGVAMTNFKICLDIGHVNKNSQIPVVEWVENLKTRIGHVHLHNNSGLVDEHRGLTDGSIDVASALAVLEKYVSVNDWCLETTEIRASVRWLMKAGYLEKINKYC